MAVQGGRGVEPLDDLAAGDRVHVDRRPARSFRHHGQFGDQVADGFPESECDFGCRVDRRDAEEGHRAVGDVAAGRNPEPEHAAVADTDPAWAERLGDDHVVRRAAGDPTGRGEVGYARQPAALLVDRAADLDRAAEGDAGAPHGFGGEEGRGQAGLHVGRAAAVQVAVTDLAAERVDGPALAGRYDVEVSVQVQGRPRLAAASPAENVDLRTLRVVAGPLDVLGLEAVGLQTDADQLGAFPVGVAGRVDARNADQLGREPGRFLTADRGLGEDAVGEARCHSRGTALYGRHGTMPFQWMSSAPVALFYERVVLLPDYYVGPMWIADRWIADRCSRSAGLRRLECLLG